METILALPSDKSTTAKIVIATSFYERFPLISNLDIDTILDNCVLDRTFYISTITDREQLRAGARPRARLHNRAQNKCDIFL